MHKIKKNCTFAICIAVLTFIVFTSLITVYGFIPAIRSIHSINDFCTIPNTWPFMPKWAVIVMGMLPIAATLWMISVLIKIRSRIVSPFVKSDAFLDSLANDKLPGPLQLKKKYGTHTNRMLSNLNIIRDHIINDKRRKDAAMQRESDARNKLDYANELKSLIISRLTPDIRMPLNSIEGYAEIIKAKTIGSGQFDTELNGIARNIAGIAKMVSRIISFSKIGHQQMELTHSFFKTADLINTLIRSNNDLLHEREVEIINIYDRTTPGVLHTDYEILIQTLLLIIRSVFRASEHGESINLCCSMDDEKVYFTIKDTARSDCREKLAELYNFHEVECKAEYLDDASSTLLGIFFAASLASYIGGELTASSNENAHNQFVLSFKKFDILSTADEKELQKNAINGNLPPVSSSNLIIGKNYLPGSFTQPNQCHDLPFRHILLGEDNTDNANALIEYLKLFNFKTVCCDNASQILKLSQDTSFDAIILSNSMRHRHMIEIIKNIRSQTNGARLPIIVLVTKLNPRKEADFQNLKVSSVLLKPIQFSALVNRLNQLCSVNK